MDWFQFKNNIIEDSHEVKKMFCFIKLATVNLHGTTMGWSCEVTCQMKYMSSLTEDLCTLN